MEATKKYVGRLMVAVRIRPLSQKESLKQNVTVIAKKVNDTVITSSYLFQSIMIYDPNEDPLEGIFRKPRQREKLFQYDNAFDESCTQQEVFQNTVNYLVESIFDGYHSSVFAYGATGAGKTYTMLGNESNPGIIPQTLDDLFIKIEKESKLTGNLHPKF